MKNCDGCTLSNPWEAQYDRRSGRWLKSLCYCCSNSVDNKPRTMSEPVSLEFLNSLEEKIMSRYNRSVVKPHNTARTAPARDFKKRLNEDKL